MEYALAEMTKDSLQENVAPSITVQHSKFKEVKHDSFQNSFRWNRSRRDASRRIGMRRR
jgi:hypothetical protein